MDGSNTTRVFLQQNSCFGVCWKNCLTVPGDYVRKWQNMVYICCGLLCQKWIFGRPSCCGNNSFKALKALYFDTEDAIQKYNSGSRLQLFPCTVSLQLLRPWDDEIRMFYVRVRCYSLTVRNCIRWCSSAKVFDFSLYLQKSSSWFLSFTYLFFSSNHFP